MPSFHKRGLLAGVAMVCLTAAPAAAFAAAAAADDANTLQEVVVTATKRSVDLQKTSAAVSVVSSETLAKAGVTDITQLNKLVPGVVIGRQGPNAVIFMRGVGQSNSTVNTQPAVSLNLDGVYMPRQAGGLSTFDLARVEALPGPQGTLYGRNSAGGAVNLVTRTPGNEFSVEGFIEAGNYSSVHAFAAADLPVVTDKLALRVAFDVNNRDGYLTNGGNDADAVTTRVAVRFKPIDNLTADVQYTHLRENGLGMQLMNYGPVTPPTPSFEVPNNPWGDTYPTDFVFNHTRGDVITGNITYNLTDHLTLSYIPGYIKINTDQGLQFGSLYMHFPLQFAEEHSNELRLANDGSGRLKWMAGLFEFYSSEALHAEVGFNGATPHFVDVYYGNYSKSYAAFGEATYSVTDRFRVTLGGRYSNDTYSGGGHNLVFGNGAIFGGSKTKGRGDYKVGVEYDVLPRSMLYATVQSGYLVGGYTAADRNSNFPKAFDEEQLTAFTLGIKNRFLDNRLQVNDEVFYYIYRNYQLQAVTQDPVTGATQFNIVPVPKALIWGNQLDTVFSVTRDTDVNVSMSYLAGTVTRGLNATPSYTGYQLPNAPKWTLNMGFEQRFPLANGGLVRFHVGSSYSSSYWSVFTHDVFSHQQPYTRTDLNLTYEDPTGKWNVGLWARNLENAAVYYGATSSSTDGTPGTTAINTFIDAPRTYGVRVGFKM